MRSFVLLAAACAVFAQDIPRPEYPQPQFQREQWLTLNGKWDFEFDDANAGLDEDWAAGAKKFSRSITVPFAFETPKSGIGDTSFHPTVWYRRTFTVPADWKAKRVLLHFGAVDYRAQVWVNGRMAGGHEGGGVPFRFDITGMLKPGANTVTVRAEDPPTDLYIPRGKQYWEPKSRSIFYTRTTGIWQPVWLEAAGDSYLEKVRITPSNDGAVRFQAHIARPQKDTEFHAVVQWSGANVAAAMGSTGSARAAASAMVPEPRLWSVSNPNLYDVTFELRRGGQVLDRVKSYFGFRHVAVEEGKVTLNGNPVYLKFVLDQGYWPESTLTPPSDDAIKYDIQLTKDMGFNGARKHQKIEDPRFLYWADKLGLLVSGEIANAYRYDEEYVQRFTREWIEAVERDYNHPSIIMWVPINESWGTPNLRDPKQQDHLRAMYLLTRSLDATRLVIDNDGWEHTDMTDLMAIHDYTASGEALASKYKHLKGESGEDIPRNARVAVVAPYKYNGTPLYLSEWGGIAYIPEGMKVPEQSWGYAGVMKSQAEATARLRGLFDGIRAVPAFVAHCYTQLTDVEQEINGLLTYDRKPKFDVKAVKEMNDALRF